MKARLFHLYEQLRSAMWPIPALMSLAAFALAIASTDGFAKLPPFVAGLFPSSPDAYRQILSTIGGSIITIAGVSFSVTVVAFSLASTQFGPRLLRNFMRDAGTQCVLGTFVATSLFCFVALVRAREGTAPPAAIILGLAFALGSLGMFIFFIHRTGRAMQADTIITNVYGEFTAVARRLLPERGEGQRPATDPPPSRGPAPPSETSIPVIAEEDGFLQVIGLEAVADKARDAEATVRFLVRPGHYLFAGRELARIELPAAADEDEREKRAAAVAAAIRDAVIIGPERTPEADLEFCLLRLVEIAQRALSPGINDPTTAMRCIDRLTSAFVLVAGRDLPEDPEGVESLPVRFEAMFEAGFNPIRQCAERLPQVALRLAEQIRDLAPYAGGSRAMLRRQIELLAKMPSLANWADLDAEAMAERVKAAEAALVE